MVEMLPPYPDSSPPEVQIEKSSTANEKDAHTSIEAQLNCREDSPGRTFCILISLLPTTTFEDFQRQIRQQWLERMHRRYGGAVWSTWLHEGPTQKVFVGEGNWKEARARILQLNGENLLKWENTEAKLVIFLDLMKGGNLCVWRPKDKAEMKAMMEMRRGMEREMLMQGKYLPPPLEPGWWCCVM